MAIQATGKFSTVWPQKVSGFISQEGNYLKKFKKILAFFLLSCEWEERRYMPLTGVFLNAKESAEELKSKVSFLKFASQFSFKNKSVDSTKFLSTLLKSFSIFLKFFFIVAKEKQLPVVFCNQISDVKEKIDIGNTVVRIFYLSQQLIRRQEEMFNGNKISIKFCLFFTESLFPLVNKIIFLVSLISSSPFFLMMRVAISFSTLYITFAKENFNRNFADK